MKILKEKFDSIIKIIKFSEAYFRKQKDYMYFKTKDLYKVQIQNIFCK